MTAGSIVSPYGLTPVPIMQMMMPRAYMSEAVLKLVPISASGGTNAYVTPTSPAPAVVVICDSQMEKKLSRGGQGLE